MVNTTSSLPVADKPRPALHIAAAPPQCDTSPRLKTRLYIVDDHELIRFGLRSVLTAEPDFEVCGESDGGQGCLDDVLAAQPDVVLVDISLRGTSGLELLKAVRASCPDMRIIVLSMYPESLCGVRAIKAGANGYCLKHEANERLVQAVRRVRSGGLSISDALAAEILYRFTKRSSDDDGSLFRILSHREIEVAELIGAGMTTQEIAVKLHISVKTIETYRKHIKEKLNLHNSIQLIQACTRWVEECRSTRSLGVGAA